LYLVVEAVAPVAVALVAEAAVAVDRGVGTIGASVAAVGVGAVAVGGGHQGALVHGVHVGPRGGDGGDGPHNGGVVSPGGGVAVGTVAHEARLGSGDGHQEGDANLREFNVLYNLKSLIQIMNWY
jgi:hypothetical protein